MSKDVRWFDSWTMQTVHKLLELNCDVLVSDRAQSTAPEFVFFK